MCIDASNGNVADNLQMPRITKLMSFIPSKNRILKQEKDRT